MTGTNLLIGDLLRSAKIIELHDLTNALQVASKTSLPVGRVLVMVGLVTSEIVQAAVQAQSLVRDHLITAEVAAEALYLVAYQRISMDEALLRLSAIPSDNVQTNKLGDMLVASELISIQQRDEAMVSSQSLGLPLGRILVCKNILPEEIVEAAINIQVLLRDGSLGSDQAIDVLRSIAFKGISLESYLDSLGLNVARKQTVRLGELFVLAGVVREADLLTALEIGLEEHQQIGQVLLEFGFVDEQTLDCGLKLQTMLTHNQITVDQAAQALGQVAADGISLTHAMARLVESDQEIAQGFGLAELLHLSGIMIGEEAQQALALSLERHQPFDKTLVQRGLLNESELKMASRCQSLVSEGLVSPEQAVSAMQKWTCGRLDLEALLSSLGVMDGTPIFSNSIPVQPAARP